MKEVIAKLLLISIIILGISYFIYDHQWNNIKKVDSRAVSQLISTNLPYTP